MAIDAAAKKYLRTKLTSPIAANDRGTLRTIQEVWGYVTAIGHEREKRLYWQQVRKLMLDEADVAAVSWQLRLALLKDGKLGPENG